MTLKEKVGHYNNNIKAFGIYLNKKRVMLNLSFSTIAKETEISSSTISDFFNGRSVIHHVYCNELIEHITRKENEAFKKS
jgi:predicted transcriptional regulator